MRIVFFLLFCCSITKLIWWWSNEKTIVFTFLWSPKHVYIGTHTHTHPHPQKKNILNWKHITRCYYHSHCLDEKIEFHQPKKKEKKIIFMHTHHRIWILYITIMVPTCETYFMTSLFLFLLDCFFIIINNNNKIILFTYNCLAITWCWSF